MNLIAQMFQYLQEQISEYCSIAFAEGTLGVKNPATGWFHFYRYDNENAGWQSLVTFTSGEAPEIEPFQPIVVRDHTKLLLSMCDMDTGSSHVYVYQMDEAGHYQYLQELIPPLAEYNYGRYGASNGDGTLIAISSESCVDIFSYNAETEAWEASARIYSEMPRTAFFGRQLDFTDDGSTLAIGISSTHWNESGINFYRREEVAWSIINTVSNTDPNCSSFSEKLSFNTEGSQCAVLATSSTMKNLYFYQFNGLEWAPTGTAYGIKSFVDLIEDFPLVDIEPVLPPEELGIDIPNRRR